MLYSIYNLKFSIFEYGLKQRSRNIPVIGGLSSKNVSELIKFRTQITEAFNEKINHLRAINKAKRKRKRK